MQRTLPGLLIVILVQSLAGLAEGQKPDPGERISSANAARLKPIAESDRKVSHIRRGPRDGELTLSFRLGEVQIVDEQTLLPRRTVGRLDGRNFAITPDQSLETWLDLKSKKTVIRHVATDRRVVFKAGRTPHAPAFSPDRKRIAFGDTVADPEGREGAGQTLVRVFETATGKLVHTLEQSSTQYSAAQPVFSPNGKRLAVSNRNLRLRIFDAESGKLLHALPPEMTQGIAFSPDGKTLAAGYVHGQIGLWDVETGEQKHFTASGMQEVYSVDWNPEGDLLVAAGRGGVSIWDPKDLTRVSQVNELPWVIQARFTHDGTRLLTSGADTAFARDCRFMVWTVDGRLVGKKPAATPKWDRPKPFPENRRPSILFAIADDWGYPHAGALGDPVVRTPTFDRLAREGIVFPLAFVSSPSCTPSRGAILTGRHFWELQSAANLWGVFPDGFATFPEILKDKAGYFTGFEGKGWGPGKTETPGRQLTGRRFASFQKFLEQRPDGTPFCYWLGTNDPHRPYRRGSGTASGIDLSKIVVPGFLPDSKEVRGDIADYFVEVQRFDTLVGNALQQLEETGELDNTIVVMTSDHGMPFPRAKANLYDAGMRVPLAIRFGSHIRPSRRAEEIISLVDLAPTFLDLAGVYKPRDERSDRSLWTLLTTENEQVLTGKRRNSIVFGRERHVPGQEAPSMGGYPARAIRFRGGTLCIQNLEPDRWPVGTPNHERATIPGSWFADTDNGPTKTYMVENRDTNEHHRRLYGLAFGKRPKIEVYATHNDPYQLKNEAGSVRYYPMVQTMTGPSLERILREYNDPRTAGEDVAFDEYPYLGGSPKHPDFRHKSP